MAAEKVISLWFFLLFLHPVRAALFDALDGKEPLLTGFTDGFSAAGNNMSLNGVAAFENSGLLRLTNDSSQVGHAFYSYPIQFKNSSGEVMSFSTAFAFAIISHNGQGGDGLAFTISPTKELPGASSGPYLGLFNASNDGNFSNHILAVELDTSKDSEFHDIDDNHAGIDINSIVSNNSAPVVQSEGSDTKNVHPDLKSGLVIQAWVEYDSRRNRLEVKVSQDSEKPKPILLFSKVNLSDILQESMYIGFSASTGSSASSHYILGWSFQMNGEAKSLYLNKLPQLPSGTKKNHVVLLIGVSVSGALAVILVTAVSSYFVRRMKKADKVEPWEHNIGPHRFSYAELKKATSGFNDKQLLGHGGFGRVYKGTLPNSGTQVAVKQISHDSKQGLQEFLSEVASIGRLRHRNLVQLLGWCRRQSDLLLVYDFMPNGSLDKYLFDEPKTILSWEQRFRIIKGVASGLLYLHEEWEQTVVHRDIKAGNVLLDSEFGGRLSDFGLARLYEHGSISRTTMVVGTIGYLAPELMRIGKPTTSSDVFAFGALLLEVACGRRPVDPKTSSEDPLLVDRVWEKWSVGEILDIVDPKLEGNFDQVEAALVLKLGIMCSNFAPQARPPMRQVLRYLEGELLLPEEVAVADRKISGDAGGSALLLDYLQIFPTGTSSVYGASAVSFSPFSSTTSESS